MSYGRYPYGGVGYAGGDVADIPQDDATPTLAVEVAFTTDALEEPAWVDITPDVRRWDTMRGRNRELERFQPGRASVVLSNLDRQYDSVYDAGPWFGNLKPMRRIRIRETFNGVTYPTFDGFVDRWKLDYPATGKDATATVTATDAFKIFNRTDLPASVYAYEVPFDTPAVWWRFDDPQYRFAAIDASANGVTATPTGKIRFGGQTLIVNDPGSSLELVEEATTNVEASYSLNIANPFAFEFWFMWEEQPAFIQFLVTAQSGGSASFSFQINNATSKGGFVYVNNAGGSFSAQLNNAFTVGTRYHIVCSHGSDRVLRIWVNGVEGPYSVQETTSGAAATTLLAVGSKSGFAATRALVDEFALYAGAVPSATRIAAHYAAGSAPWSADTPAVRAGRILDIAQWPAGLREIDDSTLTFGSAETVGQTVLEHAQKIGETEFGLMFMTRDGKVRLVDRDSQWARTPGPAIFGDDTGEIGYRHIEVDDGDEVIRNQATISRYNGVARQSVSSTSVSEFGRFEYVLDGLLHDSDTHSQDYADFIVAEYQVPRRRVTSLDLGPAATGAEADLYPEMLGRELGDAVTIRNRPPGGGDPFEQTCVIEGISHRGAPGGIRETRWVLSPEFVEDFTP